MRSGAKRGGRGSLTVHFVFLSFRAGPSDNPGRWVRPSGGTAANATNLPKGSIVLHGYLSGTNADLAACFPALDQLARVA